MRKEGFTISIKDKIINYIERCYGIKKGDTVSFELNYTEHIQKMTFYWKNADGRKYYRVITNKKTGSQIQNRYHLMAYKK